jgi:hypothetical protein
MADHPRRYHQGGKAPVAPPPAVPPHHHSHQLSRAVAMDEPQHGILIIRTGGGIAIGQSILLIQP